MPLSRNDLKTYSSLHRKNKRLENGIFIIEGIKICQEAIQAGLEIERLFITEKNQQLFPNAEIISNKDAQRISNQKQNPGVIGIVKIPKKQKIKSLENHLLVLDNIKDPGNLGSIIRTMDWFGLKDLVCSSNSVDVFNPKTIMSSMGSIFRVNVFYEDLSIFLKSMQNYPIIGTSLDGTPINTYNFRKPSIIILGSESHGISDEILAMTELNITITGKGHAESLNVGHSAAIILNEIIK